MREFFIHILHLISLCYSTAAKRLLYDFLWLFAIADRYIFCHLPVVDAAGLLATMVILRLPLSTLSLNSLHIHPGWVSRILASISKYLLPLTQINSPRASPMMTERRRAFHTPKGVFRGRSSRIRSSKCGIMFVSEVPVNWCLFSALSLVIGYHHIDGDVHRVRSLPKCMHQAEETACAD